MKQLIEKCEKLGFELKIKQEPLSACCTKIKSKARFPKPEFHYRFNSQERLEEFVNQFINRKLEVIKWKEERLEAIRKAKEELNHPFKIGQILYDSWGYDQTNIDFYQVVEVGSKTIKIQRIAGEYAKNQPTGYSSMSAFVVPSENQFIRPPEQKRILVSVYNNKPRFYIKSTHGSFCEYNGGKKGVYESWYA